MINLNSIFTGWPLQDVHTCNSQELWQRTSQIAKCVICHADAAVERAAKQAALEEGKILSLWGVFQTAPGEPCSRTIKDKLPTEHALLSPIRMHSAASLASHCGQ